MFSRTFIFLTILAALFVASSAQDSCLLLSSCDDCTGDATGSCGWCESTSECLAGNSIGPGGSALNCTEWFFDSCEFLDCENHDNCDDCLRDPFCGWCDSSDTCVPGSSAGPTTGSCDDYIFDRSECPTTSTTSGTTGTTGASTTGRRTTTTGRRTTTTGARTSTTGRRTTTTGRRSTSGGSSTSGRRSTSGGSTGAGSTGGSTGAGSTGGSTGAGSTGGGSTGAGGSTTGPAPAPPPVVTTSGGQASSAAFSLSPATSFAVALALVVVALFNLLW